MPVRPIVITGEPVLHRRAEPVTDFGPDLQALIDDMFATQTASNGVGLAAPQVGVGLRIFTWHLANEDGIPEVGVIVNPFVRPSRPAEGEPDKDSESEGCLSVPGLHYPLRRGLTAQVTGRDRAGNDLAFTATGWFARCMQHEYDHLNGFLYVDRLSDKWRKKALRTIRSEGWGTPGHSWMPGVDEDPFGH
ncbi:MAG: peptide deformylase [Dermatophilaceae bacterium]